MASNSDRGDHLARAIVINGLLVITLIMLNLVIFLISSSSTTGFTLDESFLRSLFGLSLISIIFSAVVVIIVNYRIFKNIFKPLVELSEATEEFTKGNLSVNIRRTDRSDEIGNLQNSILKLLNSNISMVNTLKDASSELKNSAEGVAKTAYHVNTQTEEITSTIQQISRGAVTQTDNANRGLESIDEIKNIIGTSLKNIEGIIKIIEGVAKQTHILALNAAIEAAKAGESGRGFSVVADNVRRLADETNKNTKEIRNLIEEITQNLNEKVVGLHETFQGFVVQSEEFSASSEEVAAATEEQTAEMNDLTVASDKLIMMSGELLNIMERFKEQERKVQEEIEKEEERKTQEMEQFLQARSIKK
ncbi:MAG: methyl-accepting chemotaxis protein [Candidatus Hodarchaeales archaeon]|jgi:methyl-accepting chemotaxis protein